MSLHGLCQVTTVPEQTVRIPPSKRRSEDRTTDSAQGGTSSCWQSRRLSRVHKSCATNDQCTETGLTDAEKRCTEAAGSFERLETRNAQINCSTHDSKKQDWKVNAKVQSQQCRQQDTFATISSQCGVAPRSASRRRRPEQHKKCTKRSLGDPAFVETRKSFRKEKNKKSEHPQDGQEKRRWKEAQIAMRNNREKTSQTPKNREDKMQTRGGWRKRKTDTPNESEHHGSQYQSLHYHDACTQEHNARIHR